MTSTPQTERQEQEIAEIATELGRADISYRYGAIVRDPTPIEYLARWLHDGGLRLVGGEAPNGIRCYDCGRPYGDEHGFPDLVVPHDVWNAHLSPKKNEGGLLCPSCMCKRAHQAGLRGIPAHFTSGPFAAVSEAPCGPTALPEEPSEAAVEVVAQMSCQDGYEGAWSRASEQMKEACRTDARNRLRAAYAAERRVAPTEGEKP